MCEITLGTWDDVLSGHDKVYTDIIGIIWRINNKQFTVASVFSSLNPHLDIFSYNLNIPWKQCFSPENVLCPAVMSFVLLLFCALQDITKITLSQLRSHGRTGWHHLPLWQRWTWLLTKGRNKIENKIVNGMAQFPWKALLYHCRLVLQIQ